MVYCEGAHHIYSKCQKRKRLCNGHCVSHGAPSLSFPECDAKRGDLKVNGISVLPTLLEKGVGGRIQGSRNLPATNQQVINVILSQGACELLVKWRPHRWSRIWMTSLVILFHVFLGTTCFHMSLFRTGDFFNCHIGTISFNVNKVETSRGTYTLSTTTP